MHLHSIWYDSRPDPESFAFSVLMNFFADPDPRIRIRVRVPPNSFRKILNMSFLKENLDPCLPLGGSVYVLHFSFKKDAVPGLTIETRIRTEDRIRASALAPVP
jgi:hypothetical protein